MADTVTLAAAVRTEFGKGAARRTRRAGLIPAVLYGHGADPKHLALPGHETFLALKDNPNALVTLDIEGESQLALAKDVQRDPVRRTIDHVDLVIINRGEKVTVDVPVHTVGDSAPGTIHTVELQTLSITVPATDIPEFIQVSIEGLAEGSVVRVSDIRLAEGVETDVDPEHEVIIVSVPRATADDLAADEASASAGAEAGADAAEGGAEG